MCLQLKLARMGKTPQTKIIENFGDAIPFITPRDMDNQRFISDTERYLSEIGTASVKNSIIAANSVLVSCIGSDMGKSAIAKYQSVTNQQINSIVVHDDFDFNFIYYNLSFRKTEIRGIAGGSAQPILNKSDFSQIKISVPPLPEQKAIAHILGSLDDKIELNRQMNETLEAMAQALFKSWFVDFDPVIDNALAAGKPIPDELSERAEQRKAVQHDDNQAVRALFPDEFVLTEEMGWIPKGWKIGTFDDHSQLIMGQSPEGSSYNSDGVGVALINGPVEFGDYFTKKVKWTTEPNKMCQDRDLIVCVRGSTTGRYVKSDGIYCIGRGVCSIRGKESQSFSDYWFKNTLPDLLRFTNGSTFPSWNGPTIKSFISIIADPKIVNRFEEIVAPMLSKQAEVTNASLSLSLLRDTLLPKLLSGELRIPDAAALVEDI